MPGGGLNLNSTNLPRPWSPRESSSSRKIPVQYLENKVLHIRNNLTRCSKATLGLSYAVYKYANLPAITYAAEAWHSSISKRAKIKLQQIQRSFLIFLTKAYRTVSLEALSAIAGLMSIDQAVSLHGLIQNFPDWCRHLYSSCGSAKHRYMVGLPCLASQRVKFHVGEMKWAVFTRVYLESRT